MTTHVDNVLNSLRSVGSKRSVVERSYGKALASSNARETDEDSGLLQATVCQQQQQTLSFVRPLKQIGPKNFFRVHYC